MTEIRIKLSIENEESDGCAICMEPIAKGQLCFTNTCRHCFCYRCLKRWSDIHNYCPLCRQLFSVAIWINHLKYENDFKLFIIENSETLYRKILKSRADRFRQTLSSQRQRSQTLIDHLRQRVQIEEQKIAAFKTNIEKLDQTNESQSNRRFEQILDEIHIETVSATEQNYQQLSEPESVSTMGLPSLDYSQDSTTTRNSSYYTLLMSEISSIWQEDQDETDNWSYSDQNSTLTTYSDPLID